MATTISTQDLENARRDIDDIGKAVNENVIVSPRYGEDFKSLPMIAAEGQVQLDQLQEAIDIAAAAGAGANGWTDLLIQTQDGDIQRNLNNFIKRGIANRFSAYIAANGGYTIGDIVLLENGGEVVSIGAANTTNPNTDMSGWKRKDAKFTFFDFGFKHNTDCTAQLQNLASYCANNDITIEDFSGETYLYSSSISIIAPGRNITIKSNCIFDSDTSGISASGSITEVGQLSANTLKASSSITLSSLAVPVSAGDILVIHNTKDSSFATHQLYYKNGEFNFAKSVSGNTISLKQQTQAEYLSDDIIKVYKLNPVRLDIQGIKIDSSAVISFMPRLFYKSKFDLTVFNDGSNPASQTAFLLDRGLRSKIIGGDYQKLNLGGTGTDYGVSIANCQDIENRAGYCYGARHGVSIGGGSGVGSVPGRRIKTIGAVIENDPASQLHAADFHGNTSDSYYQGCEIIGRISLSGFNTSSRNNRINSPEGEIRAPIGLSELVGGTIESVGDVIVSSGAASNICGWLGSSTAAKVKQPTTLKIIDIEFESNPNLIGISAILNLPVVNNFVMDGFKLNGPDTLTRLLTYSAGALTTKPSYIQITNPRYSISDSMIIIAGEAGLNGVKKNIFQTSGSNSNGSWTKFSDGTMICRHRVTTTLPINTAITGGFKSSDIPWTYPVAFISAPSITAMSFDGSSLSIRATSAGSSSAQLYSTSTVSIPSAGINFDVVAVGRWLRE